MPENYYTDIDYNLTKNTLSNDISAKFDLNAVAQSIKNIILTSKNEKIFNSKFGTNIKSLSYQYLTPSELQVIGFEIKAELALQEPRANIRSINIEDSKLGYWKVDVTFTPIYDKKLIKNITIALQ